MRELILFRAVPFAAKAWCLGQFYMGWGLWQSPWMESVVYPKLACASLAENDSGVFCVIHTEGSHAPFLTDDNEMRRKIVKSNYVVEDDKSVCAVRKLGVLLNQLRERNLYDNSFIVVCADHGGFFAKERSVPGTNTQARPFPCLLVKPRMTNIGGCSSVPTSHIKVASLLRAALSKDLCADEVGRLLFANPRRYHEFVGDEQLTWSFDADGVVTTERRALKR